MTRLVLARTNVSTSGTVDSRFLFVFEPSTRHTFRSKYNFGTTQWLFVKYSKKIKNARLTNTCMRTYITYRYDRIRVIDLKKTNTPNTIKFKRTRVAYTVATSARPAAGGHMCDVTPKV